jgi:hypothetical protein
MNDLGKLAQGRLFYVVQVSGGPDGHFVELQSWRQAGSRTNAVRVFTEDGLRAGIAKVLRGMSLCAFEECNDYAAIIAGRMWADRTE